MSFAPDYDPTKDFSQAEANNEAGRSTVSTSALDTELANIASSINAMNNNLKLMQRDDGQFKDFSVGTYALSNQLRALIAVGGSIPRGEWAAATEYAVSDLVEYTGVAYICHTAHTSSGSFDTTKFIDISGDGSAAVSAANASASAYSASLSEAAAAASAAAALASQGTASTAATDALGSETAASTSASTASSAASSATASAGQASSSAAAAIAAQAAAELATLPGRLIDIQVFNTAGPHTWTKPSGLTASAVSEVEIIGGGGKGCGSDAASAGQISLGSPGGQGAYFKGRILASLLAATEEVVVGAGGIGGTGTGGTAAESSYFCAISDAGYVQAYGGYSGSLLSTGTTFAGVRTAAGFTALTGFPGNWLVINKPGTGYTPAAFRLSGTQYIQHPGAASQFGPGGEEVVTTTTSAGRSGIGYGAAGSGAVSINGAAAAAGGNGSVGLVIVRTYS